jgi:SAM-dependent methyltransferase
MVSPRSVAARLIGPLATWRVSVIERTIHGLRESGKPFPRACNICGYQGYFRGFGWPLRPEAQCPKCESLERHRLFALWLTDNPEAIRNARVLHFAPEEAVSGLIKPLAKEYVTADLMPGAAALVIDIENMWNIADASFDAIVCIHVLEHVNDDRRALLEVHRVLSQNGVALLMTEVIEGWQETYEDPSIIDPYLRRAHFGQEDHVRMYGSDFRQRIADAGFALQELTAEEPFVLRHGIGRAEKLFIASPLATPPLPAALDRRPHRRRPHSN